MILEGTTISVEDGDPSEIILMISSDRRRANRWFMDHGINPDSPRIFRVTDPRTFLRYKNVWFVDLGLDPEFHRMAELYENLAVAKRDFGFKEIR